MERNIRPVLDRPRAFSVSGWNFSLVLELNNHSQLLIVSDRGY